MSLGDIITAALPELRAQAESLMQDTVLVESLTGEVATDPVTLTETPLWATVYQGKGRVQRPGTQPLDHVSGGIEFGLSTIVVQVPLSTLGCKRGHRATVIAIGPVTDPELLGVRATVQANLTKSHPTKRTLVCEEVT